jgi:hypothetical protein
MIQRIQSVYLLLTTLMSLLFLKGGLLVFSEKSGSMIKLTFTEIIRVSGVHGPELISKVLPLTIIIILVPVAAIITILLFKNRKIQIRLAVFLIILNGALILAFVHSYLNISKEYSATLTLGFRMLIPVLLLILSILAYRGIKKDNDLVKSYDRLR